MMSFILLMELSANLILLMLILSTILGKLLWKKLQIWSDKYNISVFKK